MQLAVKKTKVFFTIALAGASKHQTAIFQVKKVSKEIKVNLSTSKMNFLTKEVKPPAGKTFRLFAVNSG